MNDAEYARIEVRIERNILIVAAVAVVVAAAIWKLRAAGGLAIGAALCWLNFRWLRRGVAAVIQLGLAQAGAASVYVPRTVYAKFFGRIVLLVAVVYVILARFHLPAVALLCGLGAVVPAILLELVYELRHGHHRWSAP